MPKRDLNHRSRSAGYELDEQTLSLDDSIALTVRRPPKTTPKTQGFGRQLDANSIAQLAFNVHESRDRPDAHDVEDWLHIEEELERYA